MSEIREPAAANPQPATPRWKGAQCLVPVQRFNERCIELLCSVAAVGDPDLPILRENADLWTALDVTARNRLAATPFVLVNIRFHDEAWWQDVVRSQGRLPDPAE